MLGILVLLSRHLAHPSAGAQSVVGMFRNSARAENDWLSGRSRLL
jgi:hypothetical protein